MNMYSTKTIPYFGNVTAQSVAVTVECYVIQVPTIRDETYKVLKYDPEIITCDVSNLSIVQLEFPGKCELYVEVSVSHLRLCFVSY